MTPQRGSAKSAALNYSAYSTNNYAYILTRPPPTSKALFLRIFNEAWARGDLTSLSSSPGVFTLTLHRQGPPPSFTIRLIDTPASSSTPSRPVLSAPPESPLIAITQQIVQLLQPLLHQQQPTTHNPSHIVTHTHNEHVTGSHIPNSLDTNTLTQAHTHPTYSPTHSHTSARQHTPAKALTPTPTQTSISTLTHTFSSNATTPVHNNTHVNPNDNSPMHTSSPAHTSSGSDKDRGSGSDSDRGSDSDSDSSPKTRSATPSGQ